MGRTEAGPFLNSNRTTADARPSPPSPLSPSGGEGEVLLRQLFL